MGVPGLWEIINKAGKSRSFTHLAVTDGFEKNGSDRRAYCVGIDASIWCYSNGKDIGENAALRTLFFRVAQLAKLPILPLFIFDGRERPKVKRGSKMGKAGSHNLTPAFKNVLEGFGFEWREAKGEAEAELAHLNRIGVVDAIMTDDADTFLFGAHTVIKNVSKKLSGNKANPALDLNGKVSACHVMVYTADDIRSHPEVNLTQGGMILIGLLAGGDYSEGVLNCGKDIAYGLARCGFGDQLMSLYGRRAREDIYPLLALWRSGINDELRTNSKACMARKHPSVLVPATFPDMQVLEWYLNPVCSARVGSQGGGPIKGTGEMNLAKLAALCEEKFGEWGHMSAIIHRFRTVLWPAAVVRVLRRAALEADEKERSKRIAQGDQQWATIGLLRPSVANAVGTPPTVIKRYLGSSEMDRHRDLFAHHRPGARDQEPDPHPLIVKVVNSRNHVSADKLLEYSVVVCPIQLVAIARSGVKGIRPEPAGPPKRSKKPADPPDSTMKMWLPASLIQHAHPGLVEEFESAEMAKHTKKTAKDKGKAVAHVEDHRSLLDVQSLPVQLPPTQKRQSKSTISQRQASDVYVVPRSELQHAPPPPPAQIDPWFTGDYDQTDNRQETTPLSIYFLFSQNPDDPISIPEEAENPSDDDEEVLLENMPRGRFDSHVDGVFDQIMGISKRQPRPKKAASSKRKRPNQVVASTRQPRPAKKAKSAGPSTSRTHAAGPSRPTRFPLALKAAAVNPEFVYLDSDEDDDVLFTPQFTASSRTPPTSPPHTQHANRVSTGARKERLPVASSSSGGRGFLADTDNFFDLT
ncbi:hypothetical protein FIBSPDRAFT_809332 [Athelia psychrophila]|uniref:XPG-I domain-containing protein n=1 Tax=Athelia psychrophila TaxID=1759441 RepID=A0A166WYK1_9AGAM|nr:hypothetical protein FIBSPDRAFT_809332 [Fibularhizoctonia sp. CBS 109695]